MSGLPRSGSTLLMNILGQHPEVHVTPTSGCHEVLWTTKNNWKSFQEHQSDPKASSPENLRRVLSSIHQTYHDTDKSTIFDKHRSWILSIEMIEFIQRKKAKIIVPVRDIVDILSSFEKLYRKNSHLQNVPGDFLSSQTTEGRCAYWASSQGELGIAYNRLKDAFVRGLGDRLLLVDYKSLTLDPVYTMSKIWEFVGMDYPQHDFNNVIQITQENDENTLYGEDLHKIRNKIEFKKSDAGGILGDGLIERYKNSEFWKF